MNLDIILFFEREIIFIVSTNFVALLAAYEKGHQRPPLTVYTFQAPDQSHSQPASPVSTATAPTTPSSSPLSNKFSGSTQNITSRPPLPTVSPILIKYFEISVFQIW